MYAKDKDRQMQVREQAIVKVQNKAEEKCKAKATRIQQEKKFALETMMKVCTLLLISNSLALLCYAFIKKINQ